jgi:hypothetical protein
MLFSYWITLDGVGVTTTSSATFSLPAGGLTVFLDSGGTLTRLPTSLFNSIGASYPGAVYDASIGFYRVPCAAPTGSIDFTFGTNVIHVPFSEFRIDYDSTSCVLGMLADTTDTRYVLGDSFLRAAYVVFDLANNNIWLDEVADCGSNLVAIGSGANSVPIVNGCKCPSSSSSSLTISSSASSSAIHSSTITSSTQPFSSVSSSLAIASSSLASSSPFFGTSSSVSAFPSSKPSSSAAAAAFSSVASAPPERPSSVDISSSAHISSAKASSLTLNLPSILAQASSSPITRIPSRASQASTKPFIRASSSKRVVSFSTSIQKSSPVHHRPTKSAHVPHKPAYSAEASIPPNKVDPTGDDRCGPLHNGYHCASGCCSV